MDREEQPARGSSRATSAFTRPTLAVSRERSDRSPCSFEIVGSFGEQLGVSQPSFAGCRLQRRREGTLDDRVRTLAQTAATGHLRLGMRQPDRVQRARLSLELGEHALELHGRERSEIALGWKIALLGLLARARVVASGSCRRRVEQRKPRLARLA
jgi:hypothetical protein